MKPRINMRNLNRKALTYQLTPIKTPNKVLLLRKSKAELIKTILSYYGILVRIQNKYIYVTNEINFLKRKLNMEIKNQKTSVNKADMDKAKSDLRNLNLKDSFNEESIKKEKIICKCGDTTENVSGVCENCEFLENLEREKEKERLNGIKD